MYSDLPPVGTGATIPAESKGLVTPGGWSKKPNASRMGQVPRSISVGAAATVSKLSSSSATKPQQTTPVQSIRLAVPVVSTEIISQKRSADVVSSADFHNQHQSQGANTSLGASFDVEDPYEPSRPNDYLRWCEERLEKKRLDKLAEDNKIKIFEAEKIRIEMEKERAQAMESGDLQRIQSTLGAGRGRGRGLSNLPAWMAQYAAPSSSQEGPPNNGGGQFDDREEGTAASRIMSKMGHQQGEGLGRDGQGIVNALEHRKGSGGGGQIMVDEADRQRIAMRAIAAKLALVAASDPDIEGAPSAAMGAPMAPPKRKMGLFSNPSCVVLLKNMVGPGEVDEMLAEECKQECSKYGPVNTCVIFEVSEACPVEEAVRTFVFFERQESAVKAFRDMNGRFFGGRQITANFFDEGKFSKRELAPALNEWQQVE